MQRPLNSVYFTSNHLPRHHVRALSTPAAPAQATSCADSVLMAGLVGALIGAGISKELSGKKKEQQQEEPKAVADSTEIARPVSYVLEGQEDTLCSVAPIVGKAVRPEEVDLVLFHGYKHKNRGVSCLHV